MSSFTQAHAFIAYDGRASSVLGKAHWRNIQTFRYYIGDVGSDEWVDVLAGNLSDGASVPFPVTAFIPAWGSYSQNVLLHDHLCNTYEKTVRINGVETKVNITRAEIDAIFHESMCVSNVEKWRRDLIMAGINTYRVVTRPKRPKYDAMRVYLEKSFNPADFKITA